MFLAHFQASFPIIDDIRLTAFITHGGQGSITESATAGEKMITEVKKMIVLLFLCIWIYIYIYIYPTVRTTDRDAQNLKKPQKGPPPRCPNLKTPLNSRKKNSNSISSSLLFATIMYTIFVSIYFRKQNSNEYSILFRCRSRLHSSHQRSV